MDSEFGTEVRSLQKKILSTILILLTLAFIFRGETRASVGYHPNLGEDIIVGENEVVEGPYLKMGNNITVSGTINGDAYLLGSMVTINGKINGDLIAGGGVVTIKGEVTDDVRVLSGLVVVDGKVGKNVTALGGTVTFGSDTDVDGDVLTAGGSFSHLGNIDGRVLIYSGDTTLAGRVGRDTVVNAEKVSVLKTAILDSSFSYTASKEASVSAGARIAGTVQRTPAKKALAPMRTGTGKSTAGVRFGVNFLSYLSLLLLGLLFLKLAPRQIIAVAKLIGEKPWRSLGLGLLGLVLTPLVLVILVISVLGVPLAVILTGVYILMISTSSLFTGLFIGQRVFDLANLKENRYLMMAVGLLLLQLLLSLPTVGGLVRILSVFVASGAVLTLGREAGRRLR